MSLIIVVIISILISFLFSLWFKKSLIIFLAIMISTVVILEVLLTKDVAAFYYRYYYHWLFLLPLLLVLPLGFVNNIKKISKQSAVLFLLWLILIAFFPFKTTIQNIRYLNTDQTKLDFFARKYALNQVSIYDYIDLKYPKTKEIIKWCDNQKDMVNLYFSDPNLVSADDEASLKMFFTNCNYIQLYPDINQSIDKFAQEIIKQHQGAYYLSMTKCQSNIKNPFLYEVDSGRYILNQELVCSAKEVMPYLYIFPEK